MAWVRLISLIYNEDQMDNYLSLSSSNWEIVISTLSYLNLFFLHSYFLRAFNKENPSCFKIVYLKIFPNGWFSLADEEQSVNDKIGILVQVIYWAR